MDMQNWHFVLKEKLSLNAIFFFFLSRYPLVFRSLLLPGDKRVALTTCQNLLVVPQ